MMLIQQPQHQPQLVQPSQPQLGHSVPLPPQPSDHQSPEPPNSISRRPLELTKSQWETSRSQPPNREPTPPQFTLRPATQSDAVQVAQLGGSTFSATFGFSMPTVDLNAYLKEAYSLTSIQTELRDPTKHFLVATATSTSPSTTNNIIGFAQLTESTTESCLSHIPSSSLIELQRLYVHRDAQRLGVGKALMRAVEDMARRKGYAHMWLGVWEGNFTAQRVYEGCGFERVGDHEFRMGRCIQTDWIMVKAL